MNIQFTLSRKALKVRKHFPSRLVVSRVHRSRKTYRRAAAKTVGNAGW